MLERNEEAIRPEPLPGYVWLESAPQNKRSHVWAAHLEFRDDPAESSASRAANWGGTFSPAALSPAADAQVVRWTPPKLR